ncbi:BPL-N domain-containing protein [Chitinimonas naiadis]
MKLRWLLSILLVTTGLAHARTVGIFNGAGTCDGCAETVATFFSAQGDKVVYLNEHTLSAAKLAHMEVYVQPGGSDDIDETLDALSTDQVQAIREFVHDGGSYLGICAGAYLAARYSSAADKKKAYGLIDNAELSSESSSAAPSLLKVQWGSKNRMVYNQSGPHFDKKAGKGVQVLSRYTKTGRIAAQASTFGAGKVVLVGPHLEADKDWYESDHLSLQYGLNHDLFREVLGRL